MLRCVQCGSDHLESIEEAETLEVSGHKFTAKIPATVCKKCGERYTDGNALAAFELAIGCTLARSGASSGEAFRFMRKAIAMRAADLAELLDVAPETISRWETDKRPVDRGALMTLGALVIDKVDGRSGTLERLRALREPPRLARTIKIDLLETE